VSGASAGRLAGSVRWAVVPLAPAPPFRLYAGTGSEPIVVPKAETVIEAARKRVDVELSYIVPAKARPVLLLNDPPASHHREVTALRLVRLSKLSPDEQQRVRAQQEELLFPLVPERFDLPEENAAMVAALVRLHVDAIGGPGSLGRLDDNEMRVLGERIIRFYGFDVRLMLERHIRELATRRQARGTNPLGGPATGLSSFEASSPS
jgi:hypothetical protein